MKILIKALLALLPALLLADAASPMIRPSGNNIVDVGYHTPQNDTTVSKVWSQYEATYEAVQSVIIGKYRVYSDPELCLSDEDFIENCPLDKRTCAPRDEWSTGLAVLQTSVEFFDPAYTQVSACLEDNITRCEPFHYQVPQTIVDDARAAYRTAHYDWASVLNRYCADTSYTYYANYFSYGERCILEDLDKRIFSGYDTYKQCYLGDGSVAIPSDRIECGSLYDWQHLASQYYGGAVFDQGTQAASCQLSGVNPDWGQWCGTMMRTITGCTDGFSRVAYWHEGAYDDKSTSCLKFLAVSHTCPTGYSYSSSSDMCYKFSHYTYSCPTGYGDMDANHVCHRYTYTCPAGYTGPDEGGICHQEGYDRYRCEPGTIIEDGPNPGQYQCRSQYFYYDYECPSDLNIYEVPWEVIDEGGDCGGCGAANCYCNDEFPPANNCHRFIYICPYDEGRLCTEIPVEGEGEIYTNKPLIVHEITGADFVPDEYGHLREAGCGGICDFSVNKIVSDDDTLSFYNRTGNETTFSVEGCTFDGEIDAGGTRNIAAIKTSGGNDPHSLLFYDDTGASLGYITSSCPVNGGVSFKGANSNIISIKKKRDQLWFWDSYDGRGDVGLIEFVKEVHPDDYADGYRATPAETFYLRDSYFDRIFYLESNGKTYAISSKSMGATECGNHGAQSGFTPATQAMVDADEALDEMVDNYLGLLSSGGAAQESATCFDGEDAGAYYNADTDKCEKPVGICHMTLDITALAGEFHSSYDIPVPRSHNVFRPEDTIYEFYITDDCTFYAQPLYAPDTLNWTVGTIHPANEWTWSYYGVAHAVLEGSAEITEETPVCPSGAISRSGAVCLMSTGAGSVCVLERELDFSFARTTFARKAMGEYAASPQWFCSPYVCEGHTCQKASCYAGYTGSLIPVDMDNPPEPGDCTAQVCDANQPHYEYCGKTKGCPTEQPDVVQTASGCKRVTCAEGGYNPEDGMCYKWQCPPGTTESGDTCVVD